MHFVDTPTTFDPTQRVKDLGPLSWVMEELRKSLDASVKGLRRFLVEINSTQSDLAVVNINLLRTAKQNFHQVFGALKLLEIQETALMVEAMEIAVEKFVQKPALLTEDAVRKLEHGSFAVLEYLEAQLADKRVSSIGLFVQYRDVKWLAGFDRVHPADLWIRPPFQWFEPEMAAIRTLKYSDAVRAEIDSALLKVMLSSDTVAADELCQLCLSLAQSQNNPKAATFWKICAAFFEAIAQKIIPVDIYAKRTAAGIVSHYNNMQHGDLVFSDKFMQNMLFLCSQAKVERKENSPCLLVVQKTWALNELDIADFEVSHFGRFDPTILALSKKRIVVAKELWTALSGGDIQKIRGTSEQFKLVAESLVKLYPSSQTLATALTNVSDLVVVTKQPPSAELAMEVATAILYLEAVFEGWGSTDKEMELRASKLAQRMEVVGNGGHADTIEPWIEELYRRVSDRESMGSVVGELRVCLTDIEKSIDAYFRDPAEKKVLQFVPNKLAQMRGIFSVLGLEQATSAVVDMRDRVQEFELVGFDFENARISGGIDKFGNNLGALGFLIDMLNYQPALAKKLFAYDFETGSLNLLMGREARSFESFVPTAVTINEPNTLLDIQDTLLNPVSNVISIIDESASTDNSAISVNLQKTADTPTSTYVEDTALEADSDAKAEAEADAISAHAEEIELRGIFLEEAEEVAAAGLESANTLLKDPGNLEMQSSLRRAFHTLKGGARMVGLNEYGEAAWAFEQLVITKLADQKPFDIDFCNLTIAALSSFDLWSKDLHANSADHWTADVFRRAADAMRIDERFEPLGLAYSKSSIASGSKITQIVSADLRPLGSESEQMVPDINEPDFMALLQSQVDDTEVIKQDVPTFSVDPSIFVVDGLIEAEKLAAVKEETLQDKPQILANVDALVFAKKPELVIDLQHEEQFKVIGSLKIGIPLYNVYLNEADEWSRRLVTELDEWAMELHRSLLPTTMNFAHSLAGSSATVGFLQLSRLAKLLERSLQKAGRQSNGKVEHARLFLSAAEEARRLLHQFAAGFLVEPKSNVIQDLEEFLLVDSRSELESMVEMKLPVVSKPMALVKTVSEKVGNISSSSISFADAKDMVYDVSKPIAIAVDNDDDIYLEDQLDVDLFNIFEEEAQELLPRLGGALRQWTTHPDNLSARSEILRTLHTLKGSSRLAGAMRLGELSHRMESEIEALGSEDLNTGMLAPLLTRLDVLQNCFEALTHPEASAPHAEDELHVTDQNVIFANALTLPLTSDTTNNEDSGTGHVKNFVKPPASSVLQTEKKESRQSVRVRANLLDRLVNQAGEVMLTRTRIESELGQLRGSLGDLTGNLDRLRQQLRDIEFQAETQMQSRMEQSKESQKVFDPLEFDRFTRVQELTRMMAESVNDVATVQRSLQKTVDLTEDDLVAQARQTRDLQRDLLRTRMEEFESISDRLYRVVRLASKETDKQVKLDIYGGSIEIDRGVLERMTPAFEHLLRNCVAHGLEVADQRAAAGKEAVGVIAIRLLQDGNDVLIEFTDDGRGLNYQRIREQAIAQKIIEKNSNLTDDETINLIFAPGLSTASKVTELSGRGIGLDVVRSEIVALGGRIDVSSEPGRGTRFKLVLPLTTAVTQVVMMRSGMLSFGVPSHLVEIVRRAPLADVELAYANGYWGKLEENIPFYWSGALLQASQKSSESLAKTNPVIIFRSAGQRIAIHVEEIFGNKEVVIKNLGPQLARLPGLAGMAILVSGAVALIYNPVALATVYGSSIQQYSPSHAFAELHVSDNSGVPLSNTSEQLTPLILVVDDSITVRRVTQRMLQREGFRVVLAVDGLQALEKLNLEIPAVVLSDIEMPRMDGFDLVRNIRADAALKHLPVVMITSRIAEKHRELAMELGVNDYLGKPYSEEGLLAVLRQHTAYKLPGTNKS
jgi:chemosensory pili system protein ChpA (sensor histidine kinase/response regulator)